MLPLKIRVHGLLPPASSSGRAALVVAAVLIAAGTALAPQASPAPTNEAARKAAIVRRLKAPPPRRLAARKARKVALRGWLARFHGPPSRHPWPFLTPKPHGAPAHGAPPLREDTGASAPAASLFEGKGLWMYVELDKKVKAHDHPWLESYAARVAAAGVRWIAVPVEAPASDGGVCEPCGDYFRWSIADGTIDAFTRRGVSVIGWGAIGSKAEANARWTARIIRDLHLKAFIPDVEGAPYGQPQGDTTAASRRFVRTLREALGDYEVELGLSTWMPRPGTWFDFKPYLEDGWHLLPQCYLDSRTPDFTVGECVNRARGAGWPARLIHPTYGLHPWGSPLQLPLSLNRAQTPSHLRGWNVFVADYLTPADWVTLGS